MSGPLRVAATLFNLPLSLAWWLGSTLQLPLVDPTGLVVATGATLGVLPVAVWLGVLRWRYRFQIGSPGATCRVACRGSPGARRPART